MNNIINFVNQIQFDKTAIEDMFVEQQKDILMASMCERFEVIVHCNMGDGIVFSYKGIVNGIEVESGSGKDFLITLTPNNAGRPIYVNLRKLCVERLATD